MSSQLLAMTETAAERRLSFQDLVDVYGSSLPLDRALAVLAAEEQPGLDPVNLLGELDRIAHAIRVPPRASIYEAVARINHQLFLVEGFEGDKETYDHPDNSLLHRVLDRRKGLPILLSAIYVEIGRRLGLPLVGVSFPAHFIVGTVGADPRFFIDPFLQGEVLRDVDLRERLARLAGSAEVEPETWERFTAPADAFTVLTRVNTNLKRSWIRRGDLQGALRAVERCLVLSPDDTAEHRDRGLLLNKLGVREEARAELLFYLEHEPDAWDAAYIRGIVDCLDR